MSFIAVSGRPSSARNGAELRGIPRQEKSFFINDLWVAETEGFEPSIPVTRYGSLAGSWFQPLTHVSACMPVGREGRAIASPSPPFKEEIGR